MLSQLLFGEHYQILNEENHWLYIELVSDQSRGWIPQNHHTAISEEYFRQIGLSDYKVCTDLSSTIFFQKKSVHIVLGSILPITTSELFKLEEQIAYNGSSKSLSQRRDFDFLREEVRKFEHAPYLLGGKTPFGIDEGGFVQQVFKLCGYQLPRHVVEQSKRGREVKGLGEAVSGDVCYSISGRPLALIFLNKSKYVGLVDGEVKTVSTLEAYAEDWVVRRVLKDI
ncbi:hypothetical protein BFP72_12350 [Reichenbachiella sp. 5M10]|nr:hypothetical protein BFP72_12350 [Reichenbachiella sp. 5M10]